MHNWHFIEIKMCMPARVGCCKIMRNYYSRTNNIASRMIHLTDQKYHPIIPPANKVCNMCHTTRKLVPCIRVHAPFSSQHTPQNIFALQGSHVKQKLHLVQRIKCITIWVPPSLVATSIFAQRRANIFATASWTPCFCGTFSPPGWVFPYSPHPWMCGSYGDSNLFAHSPRDGPCNESWVSIWSWLDHASALPQTTIGTLANTCELQSIMRHANSLRTVDHSSPSSCNILP